MCHLWLDLVRAGGVELVRRFEQMGHIGRPRRVGVVRRSRRLGIHDYLILLME